MFRRAKHLNRSSPSAPQQRRLLFEALDSRALLAGNVLASYSPATQTLFVTGDSLANEVKILQQPSGAYVVSGVGTNVNRVVGGTFTAQNVKNITVSLGAGDDRVQVSNALGADPAILSGRLSISLGNDSDTAWVAVIGGPVPDTGLPPLTANISIDGGSQLRGAQNDVIVIANSAANVVGINTYLGNDRVYIYQGAFNNLAINAGLPATISGVTDNDGVSLDTVAALNVGINLGTSNTGPLPAIVQPTDAPPAAPAPPAIGFPIALPALPGGLNALRLTTCLFGNFAANGGSGTDFVQANTVAAGVGFTIKTFGATDSLNLFRIKVGFTPAEVDAIITDLGLEALLGFEPGALFTQPSPTVYGNLLLDTGEGNDNAFLSEVMVNNNLTVLMGGGDEDWLLADQIMALFALFDGGAGLRDARGLFRILAPTVTDIRFEVAIAPPAP